MLLKEQQKQNKVVLRIRDLRDKESQWGGLGFEESAELITLQAEANTNDWMYW